MIGLALRALGWARAALQALFALVVRYPMQVALIASLAFAGWQTWRVSVVARDAMTARAEHAATVARYTEAQRNAAIRAKAAREAAEARYETIAKETDLEHEEQLARALSAARRYVDANRVRAETASGASSGTGTRAESGSAESAIGSDQAPVLVAAEDVEICTVNTVRLESAQEWARSLN